MYTQCQARRLLYLFLTSVLFLFIKPATVYADLESSQAKTRPWFGVLTQPVTPLLAEAFGLVDPHGVLVGDVQINSPAFEGGIKPGDVIVRFDTHFVQSLNDLPRAIQMTPPGKEIEVQVIRDRRMRTLNVTLTAIPAADPEKELASFDPKLGMEIREVTAALMQKLELPDSQGVIVSKLVPKKPAVEAGLHLGDIIAEINQKVVSNLDDYLRITANRGKGAILFLVKRRGNTLFIGVNPIPE